MVAHKTTAFVGLHASLIDVFFHMAFGAVIHFHPIPAVALDS
jgi:hypothetical protein